MFFVGDVKNLIDCPNVVIVFVGWVKLDLQVVGRFHIQSYLLEKECILMASTGPIGTVSKSMAWWVLGSHLGTGSNSEQVF